MRLILGGINGDYLSNITENCAPDTEAVLAAVAYATDSSLLFDWCLKHHKPLTFYGRLDDSVPVSVPILQEFLARKSSKFVCKLVQHHHAKVIWWRGVGVYIGSANLTDSAWKKNVEAGCFFDQQEITDDMAIDIEALFSKLDQHSTPLTAELLKEMEDRDKELRLLQGPTNVSKNPSFVTWSGLVSTRRKAAADRKRETFLKDWYSTLEELRNIAATVSRRENRPSWVSDAAPGGAQADQFLHAHYYQRVARKVSYEALFEDHKSNPEGALREAISWWKDLPQAPSSEAKMLNETAPFLQGALAEESLGSMSEEKFSQICGGVHAIRDYARRVANKLVGLPENKEGYDIEEKIRALSKQMWGANGSSVTETLHYVLYGGAGQQLPARIWETVMEPRRKIGGLGISALGELVGWALPEQFPPRNGRTSKALRSLGYDVTVHGE